MDKTLKEKILAFNRARMEEGAKATDLDVVVAELLKLPPGQLRKVLTEPVLQVLAKYGYEEGGDKDGE